MVDLFNENTLFVLFFAMVAIYNYSALKEYQRMAIIYISILCISCLILFESFYQTTPIWKNLK